MALAKSEHKAEKKHRSHHAHEHGRAELDVAVDKTTATMRFEVPSASIVGFEHAAKTAEQKKQVEEAVQKFKESLASIFTFALELGCELSTESVEAMGKQHGGHAEFAATVIASCKKELAGTDLLLKVWDYFPAVEKVKVQVLGEKKQSGETLTKAKNKITL
jgi:hypothetical protein